MADRHETAAQTIVVHFYADNGAPSDLVDAIASALRRVEEAERERCAKIAEGTIRKHLGAYDDYGLGGNYAAERIVEDIRSIPARGEGT